MKRITQFITRSALMIALTVALQFLARSAGQLVTGSCVNLILAVSAILLGWQCALAVGLVSPVMAFILGISRQIILVPCIAAGNAAYVLIICLVIKILSGKDNMKNNAAVIAGAAVKFAVLHVLIVRVIGPAFLPKATANLAVQFGIIQLYTALTGGLLAAVICPQLK